MITVMRRLPPIPMTQEDYLISRTRMDLLQRLNYIEADARDAALMYALGDEYEEKRIRETPDRA